MKNVSLALLMRKLVLENSDLKLGVLLNPLEVSFVEGVKFVAIFLSNGRVEAIVDVLKADFFSEVYGSFEVCNFTISCC